MPCNDNSLCENFTIEDLITHTFTKAPHWVGFRITLKRNKNKTGDE